MRRRGFHNEDPLCTGRNELKAVALYGPVDNISLILFIFLKGHSIIWSLKVYLLVNVSK